MKTRMHIRFNIIGNRIFYRDKSTYYLIPTLFIARSDHNWSIQIGWLSLVIAIGFQKDNFID